MPATMSATTEPEGLLGLEQQSDRRRSRPILLSPPSGDGVDTREQKQAVHLLLLPEEARDRPYQHGCDYVGSDSADDDYCDLELERYLAEEMDAMDMDSSHDSTEKEDDDSSYSHSHGEEEKTSRNELRIRRELEGTVNDKDNSDANGNVNGNVNDNEYGGDVFATLEWSQFVSSADGVRRYMERASAEILEVSGVVVPSPRQQSNTHGRSNVVAVTGAGEDAVDPVDGTELVRNSDGTFAESMAQVIPLDVEGTSISLEVDPMSPLGMLEQQGGRVVMRGGPTAATRGDGSALKGDRSPRQPAVAGRSSDIPNVFIGERDSSREGDRGVVRAYRSTEVPGKSSPSRVHSPTWHSNGLAQPVDVDEKTSTVVTASSTPDPTAASSTPATPRQAVLGSPPAQQVLLVDVGRRRNENGMERVKPEAQAPWVVRSFEANHSFVPKQEMSILEQLKEACDGIPREVPPNADADADTDAVSQNTTVVVASVQEEEVERRIQRDKARSVSERRNLMAHRLARARQVRSALVFQAVWRGRCTRANVSQVRAARRRELEEMKRMYQEHQLAARLAAREANQKKVERVNQAKEQSAMRDEDERTSKSWNRLAQREKTARAEELARMRAEERYTRALLDLELQDSQSADRARREAAESVIMGLEDLEMQELRCLEKAQAEERAVMGAEDALARKWKHIEKHRLAVSQSELRRMAVEDRACSAWNTEHHREQKILRLQARARSTPIQRAMDPRGVAAARSLICALPYRSGCLAVGKGVQARPEPPVGLERNGELVKERARRRECYKGRLDRISARSLNGSTKFEAATPSKHLGKLSVDSRGRGGAYDHPRGGPANARNGYVSPREGRVGPAERDGEECDLTVDMLSHLGPLQDLAELELCVEGLTSASLLRECTSLKSLSLNVNRLSSPAGLVASTTLVRLGLRDNRLTSLKGLSGLPNLRELRLDINHLTSLHELTSLPSLIELSANTNHIRALPEGFAAALMAPSDTTTANSTKPLIGDGSVGSAVGCGGLQKLELYHNRIDCVHPRSLVGLVSLTHLDLGRNQLKTLDGRGLESCPALSTLVLSQNLLREPPSPLCLPLLSELWLSGNHIACMGTWAHTPPPPPPQQQQTPPVSIDTRGRQRQTCLENKSSLEKSQEGVPVGLGLGGCPKRQDSKNGGRKSRSALDEPGRGANLGCAFDGRGAAGESGGSMFAQGGVDADDGGNVWLPTLEVLHLQDNCLESLGGRWSLAGCPLLRSFDASFNRLRNPDEIAACLQACGDVREVRLHDNPASTCLNYADTIALSCPRLVRMDGVGVDTAVHWRAAAKTYGRRADAVLPFLLLDATEPSGSRVSSVVTADGLPPAGQTDLPTNHATGEPNASCLGINESQQCPWCGVAVSSTTSTGIASTGIEIPRGVNAADEHEPAGRRDAATLSRDGELAIPNSTTTIGDSGARGWRRRRFTCASCGGELPDTDLWCVKGSRDNQCPVRWDQVLSEGCRWRAGFCGGGASAGGRVAADGDGAVVGDAFRKVCLGGRDERGSLRRRHRREERGVASGEDLAGTQTQTETATESGGRNAARSGSIITSRRRLETELELGGRHARERRELATRQLRFHASGGGIVCNTNESDDVCVVIKLGRSPTEKDSPHTITSDGDCEIKIGGEQTSTTHRRRNQAVRVIQRLRHRRQERVAPPREWSTPSEHGLNNYQAEGRQASERAVTKVQSAFRGFHVRRALQAALDSARYVDEELEGLLRGNGGARFELNAFLAPPPELADGWWGDRDSTAAAPPGGRNAAPNGNPSGRARATNNRLLDTACAVVSNTPLSERASGSQGRGLHDGVELETPSSGVFDAGGGRGRGARYTKRSSAAGHGARMETQGVLDQHAGGATTAAAAAAAAPADPTREATVVSQGNGTQGSGGSRHEGQTVGVSRSRDSGGVGGGGPAVGAKEGLVTAWGLSDPMVARAMMKRAKRLRKFQTAEARREKLREPEARFNAFARKAGGHRTLRSMSDLSRRDIDRGTGIQRLGAGAAEAKREQGSPASSGSRAVRPRLGPVTDGWARGEIAAPRSTLSSPPHGMMRLHDQGNEGTPDQQLRHNKANSTPPENKLQPTATRPPSSSSSSSCAARPWPPPKPQQRYRHNVCRRPSSQSQPSHGNSREGWGGSDPSRQSPAVRGGRPRATLCAVELGAEAVLGDGDGDGGWVGGGHGTGAGASSKVKLRRGGGGGGAKPSSGGGGRARRVI